MWAKRLTKNCFLDYTLLPVNENKLLIIFLLSAEKNYIEETILLHLFLVFSF